MPEGATTNRPRSIPRIVIHPDMQGGITRNITAAIISPRRVITCRPHAIMRLRIITARPVRPQGFGRARALVRPGPDFARPARVMARRVAVGMTAAVATTVGTGTGVVTAEALSTRLNPPGDGGLPRPC